MGEEPPGGPLLDEGLLSTVQDNWCSARISFSCAVFIKVGCGGLRFCGSGA